LPLPILKIDFYKSLPNRRTRFLWSYLDTVCFSNFSIRCYKKSITTNIAITKTNAPKIILFEAPSSWTVAATPVCPTAGAWFCFWFRCIRYNVINISVWQLRKSSHDRLIISSYTLTAAASPDLISSISNPFIQPWHIMLSCKPRSMGPVAFASSLWHAAHLHWIVLYLHRIPTLSSSWSYFSSSMLGQPLVQLKWRKASIKAKLKIHSLKSIYGYPPFHNSIMII
jgi:hypothetical protein